MKLFMHYCSYGFSNCYILGMDLYENDVSRDAIIVDPGCMEEPMLNFIEKHEYTLRGVFITHDHLNHVHGLRTLKCIYDVDVYAIKPMVREIKTTLIKDGDTFTLGGIGVEVITVPGHSSDSAVFRVGHTLFTGDCLSAGLVGTAASSYSAAIQISALRNKVLSLPGNYFLLPGHGPPSTMDAERNFNSGINNFERNRHQRPRFAREIY
ncbi:MBL fold hydrolase [Spirochaetia bacterium]|nr:MBL fold hydrolase [Spirochaetia bacterium]